MYFIASFGLLLMYLSSLMIKSPDAWSKGIIQFSKKPYFHVFEILSRFIFGLIFLLHAEQTLFPILIQGLGYLFILVSLILIIIAPTRHRKFAIWSATRFKSTFRLSGFCSFLFGIFLIYISCPTTF
jgi:protein-S-isoprenylcysteine O-methyltransferase Ste14